MGQITDLLNVARAEIGQREGRDKSGNWNNRIKYNDWYVDSVVKNEQFRAVAWCDIFKSWVARQAGIPESVIPNGAYTPTSWNWFRSRGRAVTIPQSGDIGYVVNAQGMPYHTFIVERRDGNYIYTIEGNTNTSGSSQGNGVYRLRRRITPNLRFARPAYTVTTPAKPPATPRVPGLKLQNQVSISHLRTARQQDPPKVGTPVGPYGNEVYTLETALAKAGWIKKEQVDGHYGSSTVGDGSSGFGGVTGFQKKHSGSTNPDGWMGRGELTLLFKLAGMNVKVVD